MGTKFRDLKNKIVNKKMLNLFVKFVNLPIIGNIYDFFYFKHIKNRVDQMDFALTLEPNNICNLRCIMCPYSHMQRAKVSMPMDLFKRIVDEAKELGCKDIHLTQYNEPMTDPLIFERLAYIRERGMTSSFYSNATLMNDEKIQKLLKDPVDLARFSIDGIKKETFESIRRGANFETVVRNVSSLYTERNKLGKTLPKIEVYFTVMDRNEDQIEEFKEFWKDKCDMVSFYPTDSRETKDLVQIDYSKLKPYPCFNPKRILVLSNGKVALCCVDIDGAVELGDLNKQSLKDVLMSEKFQDVYNNQINRQCNIGMCKGCSKFYIDSAFSWWGSK